MGYSCAHAINWSASLVTVSLAVDFIGTAQIGQWLAVESAVIKTGSTICFAQSLIKADDAVIARANGTFRVVKKRDGVVAGRVQREPGTSRFRVRCFASPRNDRSNHPKCQSLISTTRSMKVRTFADNSRDVG